MKTKTEQKNNNTKSDFKKNIELKTKDKIDKFKKGRGRFYFLANPNYPDEQKEIEKKLIFNYLKKYDILLPEIEKLIKKLHKYVKTIWNQDKFSAAYLLLGKSLDNFNATILLAKNGHSLGLIELVRSGIESLDLSFLLLEDTQTENLNKWFKGEIIEAEKSRKVISEVINKELEIDISFEEKKIVSYRTFSLYTHNSYSALLDEVDVFNEDLDFKKYAGFHYSKEYLNLINDFAIKICLQLKTIFLKCKDLDGVNDSDVLLRLLEFVPQTKEELLKDFDNK